MCVNIKIYLKKSNNFSHISGISLLGLPADAYRYGGSFLLGGICILFVTVATIFIYLPVFFDVRATSMYAYLERRFDHKTRLLASFLYVLSSLLSNPVIVYVAALAFSTGKQCRFKIQF
jgi:sodium-coupled monocarboxylate transporter 8/12